jgi:predicted AAA+ superfamily ATPase
MLGRYYYYRLHPLSFPELHFANGSLEELLKWGGFPEPFLKKNLEFHSRWTMQRVQQLVREDVRDLESVKDISLMELLADALPQRVGSPLSVRNLALDLEIDPKTCKKWIGILEALYYCYRISPFGKPKLRTVKFEQKLYLWDWPQVPEAGGFRFENLVAGHLLKFCHFMEDTKGTPFELRFLRDTEKREIDFVVLKNKQPLFAVECKTGEKALSPGIAYFSEKSKIPKFYQVHLGTTRRVVSNKIEILSFELFCKIEKLV